MLANFVIKCYKSQKYINCGATFLNIISAKRKDKEICLKKKVGLK